MNLNCNACFTMLLSWSYLFTEKKTYLCLFDSFVRQQVQIYSPSFLSLSLVGELGCWASLSKITCLVLCSVSKGDVALISLCNCCVPKGDEAGVVSISCVVMSGEFVVLDGPNFLGLAPHLLAHEARGEVGDGYHKQ